MPSFNLRCSRFSGLQDLNVFNFFYVDDQVAVAQGKGVLAVSQLKWVDA